MHVINEDVVGRRERGANYCNFDSMYRISSEKLGVGTLHIPTAVRAGVYVIAERTRLGAV